MANFVLLRYVKILFSGMQTLAGLVVSLEFDPTTLQLNQVSPNGQHSLKQPTIFI